MGSQGAEQLHRDTGVGCACPEQCHRVRVICPSGLKSSHRMAQGRKKKTCKKLHHNSVFWPSDSS